MEESTITSKMGRSWRLVKGCTQNASRPNAFWEIAKLGDSTFATNAVAHFLQPVELIEEAWSTSWHAPLAKVNYRTFRRGSLPLLRCDGIICPACKRSRDSARSRLCFVKQKNIKRTNGPVGRCLTFRPGTRWQRAQEMDAVTRPQEMEFSHDVRKQGAHQCLQSTSEIYVLSVQSLLTFFCPCRVAEYFRSVLLNAFFMLAYFAHHPIPQLPHPVSIFSRMASWMPTKKG